LPPAGANGQSGTKGGTTTTPITGLEGNYSRLIDNQGSGKASLISSDASLTGSITPVKAFPVTPNVRGTIQSDATPGVGVAAEVRSHHIRSHSHGSGLWDGTQIEVKSEVSPKIDVKLDVPSKNEVPPPYGIAPPRVPEGSHVKKRNDTGSTYANTPLPQQRPPPIVRASSTPPPPAKASTSLDGFDPLRPRATSNMESEVFPAISFPTNVSVGTVPVVTTSSLYYQHQSGNGAYSTPPGPADGDNHNGLPITFGMSAADAANTQQPIANGFQMQQPYAHHQPIMLQQGHGDMQHWAVQQPPSTQYYQPTQEQQQHHLPPSVPPSNPFDPFGA
jgi:hypothetical protein